MKFSLNAGFLQRLWLQCFLLLHSLEMLFQLPLPALHKLSRWQAVQPQSLPHLM